jgi:hypothetical protein
VTTAAGSKQRRIVLDDAYRRRHEEYVRQRLQQRREGIAGLAVKADDGEPDGFIDFVCSDPRLSGDEHDTFRWFLGKALRKVPAHRPRGSFDKPNNAAITFAAHLVKVASAVWCRRYRRKRATHQGLRAYWRACAIELAVQAFPQLRGQISDGDVRECDLHRKPPVTAFVDYDTVVESEFVMRRIAIPEDPGN